MQRHLANVRLSGESRQRLIELLNRVLAGALDLSLQSKHAHWNVRGPDFVSFHELFDELSGHLRHHADVLAERATALGGIAQGTARLVAENSDVAEYALDAVTSQDHVRALAERLSDHAAALADGAELAARLGDKASEDIFVEQLRELEKDLWFLDASSSAEEPAEEEAEAPAPVSH